MNKTYKTSAKQRTYTRNRLFTMNEKTRPSAHRHGMRWTNKELDRLYRLYDKADLTIAQIAVRLGRTFRAVDDRLSVVGR